MNFDAKNTISDERFAEELLKPFVPGEFKIDLQLFGKSKGKTVGKILITAAAFAFGAGHVGMKLFGVTKSLVGGIMASSLVGSIWMMASSRKMNQSSPSIQRFDKAQESMSSTAQIPVVYGMRKISGNQTYHETNAKQNTLHKHVVLCEGGIEGIVSVCANDLLIPTGEQVKGTVFTIQNVKYEDAQAWKDGKNLHLYANGKDEVIYLCNKKDADKSDTFYEWQASTSSLISYINRMRMGWQAFPYATSSKYPGDLKVETPQRERRVTIGTSEDCDEKISKDQLTTYENLWNGSYKVSFGEGSVGVAIGRSILKKKYHITGRLSDEVFYRDETYYDRGCYMNPLSVTASTVTGGTKYTFHDCEAPDNYEEVGGYPHMAWLDMTFQTSNELNGNPSVDCIVKGRKVYDPRSKTTAYSNNPALCVLDFLTNRRYGLGEWVTEADIDIDSFIEAANYCDEEITVYDADDTPLRSKRYELNMIVDERQDASQWLQDMLANFCAWLVISKDKIKLMVEQESPVVHKFDDDSITSMTITPIKASDVPNHYEISLCNPESNWRVIQVVCDDYADQKQRGKVISKTVELSGVTSQSQALRLARFYSDYNLSCPIVVSFTTGIEAMALEPGDVISVSYRDALKDMPVRISEIRETDENEFEITARQYNGDIYSDELGGGIQTKSYTIAKDISDEDSPYFVLTNVTNLKAISQHRKKEDGTVAYDIVVSFDLPTQYTVKSANVYYKQNNAPVSESGVIPEGVAADEIGYQSEWRCAGESTGTLKIPNAKIGDVYKIRVATISKSGKEQDIEDCPEVLCRVTARETIPSQPYNLTFDFTNDFSFSWSDVVDSDVVYYELRSDTNKGNPVGLLVKTAAPTATVKLTSRSGKAYVYAVNQQGKYSYPAECEWNYPKPEAPDKITFSETPRGVRITTPFFPAGIKKARLYITGASSSDVIDTLNPVYDFKGSPSVYSIRACWIDLIGEGYVSQEYSFTVNPTFNPDWIADGSMSLEKMDGVIKGAVKDAQDSVPRLKEITENIDSIGVDITGINTSIEGISTDITGINTNIEGINTNILSIEGNITELKKADGEITATITKTNTETQEKFASQLTQKAESIMATVAANKKDQESEDAALASQIKQTADNISSAVEKKISGVRTDLSKLDQKAESIMATVTKNKNEQAKTNEDLASQISQTAESISATVETKIKGVTSDISKVDQKADGISATVAANKKAQDTKNAELTSQIKQSADSVTSAVQKKIDGVVGDISKVSQRADSIESTVSKNKKDFDEQLASQLKQTSDSILSTVAANKKAQDTKNAELTSQIKQSADSVTSAVQKKIDGLTSDISKVDQKADGISTTVQNRLDGEVNPKTGKREGGIVASISKVDQKADGISSTVQKNKKDTDSEISQIKQTASALSTTVQTNKTNTDKSISGLSSTITQQANSITAIVTNLGKSPTASGYSALTQLQNGINARVVKTDFNGKNIINQINLTEKGTTIDGQYLHITGTTQIEKDVIVGGMIKAGSISTQKIAAEAVTSDKISSRAITADKLNVSSLSAISANIGTLRTKESGARVEISNNLIQVFDENDRLRVKLGVW
ncbi:putative phage tail protein (plasmid) [Selenomonas ruminantium subsp. lactilytica TAM6421]|uniref:Putative phage tail protein n=1 Tax=Selenomonas ruminantium subsp. lactilytica (strain NBRC 103574 / TAM6421) TaxID=927704 RepID=I0GVA6_SELRL|nr:phage tail protein [Selenomonas ruminantium]BAL84693.1 putative phage tail protein [Selenomonas ruminantium subsp. lactilytica TAM6421]